MFTALIVAAQGCWVKSFIRSIYTICIGILSVTLCLNFYFQFDLEHEFQLHTLTAKQHHAAKYRSEHVLASCKIAAIMPMHNLCHLCTV
jgi:hypothetical protein